MTPQNLHKFTDSNQCEWEIGEIDDKHTLITVCEPGSEEKTEYIIPTNDIPKMVMTLKGVFLKK